MRTAQWIGCGLPLRKPERRSRPWPGVSCRCSVRSLGVIRSVKDEEAFANLDALVALARHPNIAVKATGAPSHSTGGYPYRNIHDGLHRIYDAFGPGRFFWGTDITRMPCSYRQCVTMFTEELSWLRGRDLELVMGQGIIDWLGWQRST